MPKEIDLSFFTITHTLGKRKKPFIK